MWVLMFLDVHLLILIRRHQCLLINVKCSRMLRQRKILVAKCEFDHISISTHRERFRYSDKTNIALTANIIIQLT